LEAIRRALEDAGVEFTNGERPGVRLSAAAAGQGKAAAPNAGTGRKRSRNSKKSLF
jgi:hypothetical protein